MSARADALADRILKGARALAKYANGLTDKQWATPTSDGRPVGVVVHHVASVYPLEVDLAQVLAAGKPIKATWADVNAMNANHAKDNASVSKADALALLKKNSTEAAERVRKFTNKQLDTAAACGLNANAPLTAQFFIEDHALRHSFHHLAKIKQVTQ